MITFATGCSGIGAPEVAWGRLGWKSLWCSEIEPFPSAVLKHHWTAVPNHGDFNKLSEKILRQDIPAPDVFIAGTPCQAFSLAGLRESLNDKRGNLTLKYVEIINAIDTVRTRAGLRPAIAVWENVPGVLSTKDNAFGCFLGGLAGSDEAVVPGTAPEAGKNSKYWRWDKTICKHIPKWSSAGVVFGTQRTVAWRVLDAQFFGVAQRRRRVFVVACVGSINPCEILFEFDGVSGDSAESRETRKGVADSTKASSFSTSRAGYWRDGIGALRARKQDSHENVVVWPRDVAATIDASYGRLFGCDNQHVDAGCPNFVMATGQCNAETSKDISPTLNCNHEAPILVAAFGPENGAKARSIAYSEKTSPTLKAAGSSRTPAVMRFYPTQDPISHKDISHALGCGSTKGQCSSAVVTRSIVRRLTPLECERLQGFPDNHTNIPWKGKPDAPDSLRYKATGNSMARPAIEWLGLRIEMVIL